MKPRPSNWLSVQSLDRNGRARCGAELLALLTIPVAALVMRFTVLGRLHACTFLWLTGRPCPFCGMTRSLLAIMRGAFTEAFKLNFFGPVIATAAGLWMLNCAVGFACGRRAVMGPSLVAVNWWIVRVVLALWAVYWLLRLAGFISFPTN